MKMCFVALVLSGCSGGASCTGVAPLPKGSGPFGFPTHQQIQGGMQLRVTPSGVAKIGASFQPLIDGQLVERCASPAVTVVQSPAGMVTACGTAACPGGAIGCPVQFRLSSSQRPSGTDDGKDRFWFDFLETPKVALVLNRTLDAHVSVAISYVTALDSGNCTLDVTDAHDGDDTANPVDLSAEIDLAIDPTTGALDVQLGTVQVQNLNLTLTGCGVLGSLLASVTSSLQTSLVTAVTQAIVQNVTPALGAAIAASIPKPTGFAASLPVRTNLSAFQVPGDATLELLALAGGSVTGVDGGLNLEVLAGFNSDSDPSTRQGEAASQAAACAPPTVAIDLGAPPWSLQADPKIGDFVIPPAFDFAGSPEPLLGDGGLADLVIGVSQTFLRLGGLHAVRGGATCLTLAPPQLPSLTAEAFGALIDAKGSLLQDPKAALALSLHHNSALAVTLGSGAAGSPMVRLTAPQLTVSLSASGEDGGAPAVSVVLDLQADFNLDFVPSAVSGAPAVEPLMLSATATGASVQLPDGGALQVDPAQLGPLMQSLAAASASVISGVALQAVPLPSAPGWALDSLSLKRVHAAQDEFIAVQGSLQAQPVTGTPVQATAKVSAIQAPTRSELRALFGSSPGGSRPTVTLDLGATAAAGRSVEWSYRLDSGAWTVWRSDPAPVVSADGLLLAGPHWIEVRGRAAGDWRSTDPTPVRVDFSIPLATGTAVQAPSSGCGCGASGSSSPLTALLWPIGLLLLLRGRREGAQAS